MGTSSFIRVAEYKSPIRVVAGVLWRSRETHRRRGRKKDRKIADFQRNERKMCRVIANRDQELAEARLQMAHLRAENHQLRQQPVVLPEDPVLPCHQFGARMISLCVNLARVIGLRPSVACLQIVFEWLGVTARLPDRTSVRLWMMRVGVAALEEPVEVADDWIWMADHSNQIGPEKVLAIIGVRASKLPPPGVALTHADMRVLMVKPGVSWKREDVGRAYLELAERAGKPLAVIVDGAVELREGAEVLHTLCVDTQQTETLCEETQQTVELREGAEVLHTLCEKTPQTETLCEKTPQTETRCEVTQRKQTLILGDFKHYAANVLKREIGGDEQWTAFTAQVGSTRSSIQQTELGHLTPPRPRPKARFMNLAPTLKWARMVAWQLAHPHSTARAKITAQRFTDKLGWLGEFTEDIARWNACQEVVNASLTFINQQGLSHDAADQLAKLLQPLTPDATSRSVADQLIQFVRQSAAKLSAGQRLPLSTEILESAFGLFKQLERQHSQGGFTSLLAAFGALLKPTTPASIRTSFARTSVKQLRAWVNQNLPTTLNSQRQTAYQESKSTA